MREGQYWYWYNQHKKMEKRWRNKCKAYNELKIENESLRQELSKYEDKTR